jgi:hypothetical protein
MDNECDPPLQIVAAHHVNASGVGKIWEVGIVSHYSNVFRSITIGVWEEDDCQREGAERGI